MAHLTLASLLLHRLTATAPEEKQLDFLPFTFASYIPLIILVQSLGPTHLIAKKMKESSKYNYFCLTLGTGRVHHQPKKLQSLGHMTTQYKNSTLCKQVILCEIERAANLHGLNREVNYQGSLHSFHMATNLHVTVTDDVVGACFHDMMHSTEVLVSFTKSFLLFTSGGAGP